MSVSLAAAKDICVDAASELDGILTLKEEQRAAPEAFLGAKDVFTLLPIGFGRSFAPRLTGGTSDTFSPHTNRKPWAVANYLNWQLKD